VDYVSGRKPIFWGSLGRGDNVCTMPFPLLFNGQVILFSFVVVTLYIAATLVSYPMEIYSGAGHMPLLRFYLFALAWCQYVFFASIQKMPSPYPSMSPCICVSTVHIPPLATA
jgi:hypothetical protein